MDRKHRDILISKIVKYTQRDNKGHIKYKRQIIDYIETLLGRSENIIQTFNNKWEYIHCDVFNRRIGNTMFMPFKVMIYFPWEGIKISMSIAAAEKIDYFERIISNKYSEKPLQCKYIDEITRFIVDGPLIIVSMALTESIILPDGRTLKYVISLCHP